MNVIFKEKEEVQEFLKNLGIEYRFSCYSENNPQGCQLLAEYLAQVDKEYKKSTQLLKDNCDKNNFPRSCANYGQNLLYGKGCVANLNESLKYLEKGCELNDATGCDFIGKLYCGLDKLYLKKLKPDFERGLKYLEHGCNLEDKSHMFESSESCYAAAFVYIRMFKNFAKAAEYGAKACEMVNLHGCQVASVAYKKLGDNENSTKFENLYRKFKKQVEDNVNVEMQRT